ncbi:MAG: prepilin-type N-terminal cleavage/methylation domain-containing protein [Lachnospiraceae bacterium]|nr:prepilin-type N-terminal cleavage/methylation domain-containing protein [Lachnospiraceae bacterium]
MKSIVKNNRGVTLVELLIVLAISAILLGLVGISYSLVSNANVSKAATRLTNIIRTARTTSMSKGTEAGKLTLYEQHGSVYARIGDGQPEVITKMPVTMTAKYATDYSDTTLASEIVSSELRFTSSGMLRTAGIGDAQNKYNMFLLTNGRKNMKVLIYLETGKVEVTLE